MMPNLVCLFNHKGGVSKTTTAFNLGWMLARKNRRVLLVDCDPQCNLTGMVLGLEDMDSADSLQGASDGKPLNVREGVLPAFESRPERIQPVECVSIHQNDNLYLLPGHIGLAEYEITLGIAQELSGSLVTLQNLPGALHHLMEITADKYEIDLIIIDMSPSLGAVNQNLLSVSDYFIVPTHPDYFSNMAIKSLASVIPKWRKWSVAASNSLALKEAAYPFPAKVPRFLGYVVQNYRPRNGAPAHAFNVWIEELKGNVKEILIPAISECEMMLDDEAYEAAGYDPSSPLLQMPDFNSLIASSQTHQTPIFELTAEQLGQVGQVLKNTQESQRKFEELFSKASEHIIAAINASSFA